MDTARSSNNIMLQLKPTLDAFSKKHSKRDLTDVLRRELAEMLDVALRALGYDNRLVRVVEPQPNGDTTFLVFTRDDQDETDNKFTMTTITIRGRVVPEEIQ